MWRFGRVARHFDNVGRRMHTKEQERAWSGKKKPCALNIPIYRMLGWLSLPVERRSHNPKVASSILAPGISLFLLFAFGPLFLAVAGRQTSPCGPLLLSNHSAWIQSRTHQVPKTGGLPMTPRLLTPTSPKDLLTWAERAPPLAGHAEAKFSTWAERAPVLFLVKRGLFKP